MTQQIPEMHSKTQQQGGLDHIKSTWDKMYGSVKMEAVTTAVVCGERKRTVSVERAHRSYPINQEKNCKRQRWLAS